MEAINEARSKVNGKFLADYSGKPVVILGKVLKVSLATLYLLYILINYSF